MVSGPFSATFSFLAQTSSYAIDSVRTVKKEAHKEQVSHLYHEQNLDYCILFTVTSEQKFKFTPKQHKMSLLSPAEE